MMRTTPNSIERLVIILLALLSASVSGLVTLLLFA
jgi:hypothetical protein